MVTAIIVAAGKSERMGAGTDKAFLNLGPKPVVAWNAGCEVIASMGRPRLKLCGLSAE